MSDMLPALRSRPGGIGQIAQLDLGIPPPANLTPESFAERLYLALAPVANLDSTVGWSLLILCNAIGQMFQLLDDLERDTPEGPGWSVLMDLERCPPAALPWLGQFVGVRIPVGLSEADQRAWIASTDGWRRGTPAALRGAVAATLTGSKAVVFRERDGAAMGHPGSPDYAYCLTVNTYETQTPDPAATLAALMAQKPGGIVLNHKVVKGQDYQSLRDNWATYQAVKAGYADYFGVVLDEPTTP